MALKLKLEGDILEVTEITMSANETRKFSWFYNIKTWEYREQGHDHFWPMDDGQIDWVKKHYLPKVQP